MARSVEAAKLNQDMAQGNLRQYEGEWIAVHKNSILDHAPTLDDLLSKQSVKGQMDFPDHIDEQEKIKRSPLFMYVMGDDFQ